MLKKTLALLAGLAVALTAYAATTHLKPGHPDRYVVKKGDTLWDISARFLTQPWYWPEIWQANPQVHNPHLIYPGDVLNLAYDHGNATLKLEPSVHEGKAAIPAIPLSQLEMFLKNMRVIDSGTLDDSPYVMAFEESQLRGIPGKFVYVRQIDARPGQKFAIVRPSHVFRQYDEAGNDGSDIAAHELESNVEMAPGPWKENFRSDGHYGRGDEIGVEVQVIGHAEVLRTGDPATLLITDSRMEIRKGDRLLPANAHPYDPYFYPHAPKSVSDNARVIAFSNSLAAVGKRQVVALSIGSDDGIVDGATFSIFQPGDTVHDDVSGYALHSSLGDHVKLPDEFIGHVMVFRTFQHVSYGLVMDSIRPVKIGDELKMPE
ncbi:MAG TPA: LysM domain-containing protein [Rhodanobacteraceae bacterium]|nr:LysM domain-containing protein [Rhodanobacteraceae bacterium]